MMPEDVPACLVCSKQNYSPGGGNFSPGLQQQGFRCTSCQAKVEYIALGSCAIIVFNLDDAHIDYINGALFSAWRVRNKKIEDARSALIHSRADQINTEMGLPRGTTGYDLLGEGKDRAQYDRWCERLHEFDKLDQDAVRACAVLVPAVLPPRMPLDMLAYNGVQEMSGIWWVRLDPKLTQADEVPVDPIRIAHDQLFEHIFAEVQSRLDFLCETECIPNEYYNDKFEHEPWFRFGVGSGTIVIGPRKRVIAISATRHEQPFNVSALRDIAKTDSVTWYSNGSWQGTADTAGHCEIHAYGRDKAVEYLTLLITALR